MKGGKQVKEKEMYIRLQLAYFKSLWNLTTDVVQGRHFLLRWNAIANYVFPKWQAVMGLYLFDQSPIQGSIPSRVAQVLLLCRNAESGEQERRRCLQMLLAPSQQHHNVRWKDRGGKEIKKYLASCLLISLQESPAETEVIFLLCLNTENFRGPTPYFPSTIG